MERLLNAMTILSIVLMLVILYSVRRSHIRVEYSVSWLAAAFLLLVLSRSPGALNWIAAQLGLTYPPVALMMLVFCVFVVVIYRFSVVISDLKDANIAMTQRLAIVEFQLQNRNESSKTVKRSVRLRTSSRSRPLPSLRAGLMPSACWSRCS